jgi:hypothetical protein
VAVADPRPASRDAEHMRLLDDREEGPLGPPPRLEERGEVRAVADPRDRQVQGAHSGVPAPVAMAVPGCQPALWIALALGQSGELADLGPPSSPAPGRGPLHEGSPCRRRRSPCVASRAAPSCHRPIVVSSMSSVDFQRREETRWQFSFTAPLVHQVWGHHHRTLVGDASHPPARAERPCRAARRGGHHTEPIPTHQVVASDERTVTL